MIKRIFFITLGLSLTLSAWAQIIRGYSASSLEKTELSMEERFWLNPLGPLSKSYGVTGSYGPLGMNGPFGDQFWNATFTMNLMGNWEELAQQMTALGGPLSDSGPLFLTSELAQVMASFMLPPTARQMLMPGGVLHVVGNAGPLGPLGIAGALGPHGAHGYQRNERGDYLNKTGRVVKTVKAEKYELYELYHAKKIRPTEILDTSFAIRGEVTSQQTIKYHIKSSRGQWVNILLVNEFELDRFELTVKDQLGKTYSSDSMSLSAFVNVLVRADSLLEITINLARSAHFLKQKPYRLYVTGSRQLSAVEASFQE